MSALATPAAPAVHSALQERLVREHGATFVTPDTLDAWAAPHAHAVLLLAGDAVRFPEGQDVAAVLPELIRACGEPCAIGLAARADEDALARRLGVQRWPTLVCFAGGRYADALAGMHDWADYPRLFSKALAAAPTRVPIALMPAQAQESCR